MGSCLHRLAIILVLSILASAAAAEPKDRPIMITAALQTLAVEASPHPFAKWQAALAGIEADRLRVERCLAQRPCRDILAKPLADLVKRLSSLKGTALLVAVNPHFHSFPYAADQALGRASDDWASPLAFLQRSGDCEDFAIAKFLTLRLLGLPETAMAMLVLRDRQRGIDHAVLLVEERGRWLVLDNLRELAPLEEYRNYRPLLALTAASSLRLETHRAVLALPLPSAAE